jgi:putative AdoMet-dependent methyltransferase
MRSRNVDRFNHDLDALSYDSDVANESDPIRAGYLELLRWVADRADVDGADVIELGAGTGNLTALLRRAGSIEAVDASAEMLSLLRQKCGDAHVRCHQADLLGYFDEPRPTDRIVSTYAVHHLEQDEKHTLFERIRKSLRPHGIAVFGDLMFASAAARDEMRRSFAERGEQDVVDAIDEEFFWLLDDALPALLSCGFRVETRRFSELSWGVCCRLR